MRARLAAGVHTIKFRARSPQNASVTEVCQTVINVKSAQATPTAINYPEVVYCPPNIDIQLEPNEHQRPVFWKDPKFNSDKHLKQILASQLPGTKFSVGRHNIVYTATDLFNRNATCRFAITLTASPGWYFLCLFCVRHVNLELIVLFLFQLFNVMHTQRPIIISP